MKKFKTLKDIILEPEFEMDEILQIKKDLQEAVKEWLKVNPDDYPDEIYKCPKCKTLMMSDNEGYNMCKNCNFGCYDVECWIRYFFNIEDD